MLPPSPRYGSASLADLLPSVLAALGVPGEEAVLDVALERPLVCLLLVDGLGADLLAEHAAHAPFLAGLHDRARDLDCGFPSTTATSLGSLGVGRPPGVHGLAGYTVRVPETGAILNHLRWDQPIDAERWQPYPTAFQRAAAAGVAVTRIGPWSFHGTGLTTAALRGGDYRGADALGERIIEAGMALERPGPALVYVYEGDLDSVGHRQAPGSAAWLQQLALTDGFAARVAEALPAGATLLVTGDHGMVTVPEDARVDLDADPALGEGVVALASEPRARYVHTRRAPPRTCGRPGPGSSAIARGSCCATRRSRPGGTARRWSTRCDRGWGTSSRWPGASTRWCRSPSSRSRRSSRGCTARLRPATSAFRCCP